VTKRQWRFVAVVLLLATSCASGSGVAMSNVTENWGGPSQLSTGEQACLQSYPVLAAAVEESEMEKFLERVSQVPGQELACFGSRAVSALIPEDSSVGKCWRESYLQAWAAGIRQGEAYYSNTFSKVGPSIREKCGERGQN
jgi:hypothetical protein